MCFLLNLELTFVNSFKIVKIKMKNCWSKKRNQIYNAEQYPLLETLHLQGLVPTSGVSKQDLPTVSIYMVSYSISMGIVPTSDVS